jgi:hypothetical protein
MVDVISPQKRESPDSCTTHGLFGQGFTLPALSTQAVPAFASLLAGAACQDKLDEVQPRPNNRVFGRTLIRN